MTKTTKEKIISYLLSRKTGATFAEVVKGAKVNYETAHKVMGKIFWNPKKNEVQIGMVRLFREGKFTKYKYSAREILSLGVGKVGRKK